MSGVRQPGAVLAALVLISSLGSGCGGASQQQLQQARQQGKDQQQLRDLQKQVDRQRQQNQAGAGGGGSPGSPGPGGGSGSGGGGCGGGVSAGPSTTCPFAQNVRTAYYRNGGGNITVDVYSPVTGQTYSMSCGPSGGRVVCTGGNGASVYFR
jgi:type II secretory pathway pseudopilin PulG